MATVTFAQSIRSHVEVAPCEVVAATVGEALEAVFAGNERLRGYVLDDAGALRKHVSVIVNGETVRDRRSLSDPLALGADIFVMQALSGG
jgi:hypothetical protein